MTFLPKNILYFLVVLKLYMTTHKLLKRMSGCGFLVCLFLDLICNASEFFFLCYGFSQGQSWFFTVVMRGQSMDFCRHSQDPNVIPYHLMLLPGSRDSLASYKGISFQMGRKNGANRVHPPLFPCPELGEYLTPSLCTPSLVLLLLLFVFLSCCYFQ